LVFSKAHSCYAIYAILADIGYIHREAWDKFYKGSFLSGCRECHVSHGIAASCGSSGHGVLQATGIAFGARWQAHDYQTYCIAGDGEMQEGTKWEAMQVAVTYELDNLNVIVDRNHLQAMDFLDNILTPKEKKYDLEEKMKAFGFCVKTCDGHNLDEITTILNNWRQNRDEARKPQVLIPKKKCVA